jgi:hypothetical protein
MFGKVTRIENFGLGFVRNEETNEQFAFTFDKIAGYRGEFPSQVGFRVGSPVTFHLNNGLVDSIQLASSSFSSVASALSFDPFKQ